jgi:hypothetical protein
MAYSWFLGYWGTMVEAQLGWKHIQGRALLRYVFLGENTHKLDAEVMGESGNLLQWVAVGYIGMGYLGGDSRWEW